MKGDFWLTEEGPGQTDFRPDMTDDTAPPKGEDIIDGYLAAIYDSKFKRLRLYNAVMGVFHLIQAIVVLALTSDYSLPVTTSFLNYIPDTGNLEPKTDTLFTLHIGYMVALFLLLSAAAHFIIVLPSVFVWYKANLLKGINYARWFEYALSASVMIIIIAMLSGMYDIAGLILIFTCTAIMNLMGLMMEIYNQLTEKTKWSPFIIGSIAGIVPWIAISIYFFGSVSTSEGNVPTFVYFILPTLFIFFFCFAVNMVLQYKRVGPWRDYLFGETVYVMLSLVAKSALAWQVFAGTLRPG